MMACFSRLGLASPAVPSCRRSLAARVASERTADVQCPAAGGTRETYGVRFGDLRRPRLYFLQKLVRGARGHDLQM